MFLTRRLEGICAPNTTHRNERHLDYFGAERKNSIYHSHSFKSQANREMPGSVRGCHQRAFEAELRDAFCGPRIETVQKVIRMM